MSRQEQRFHASPSLLQALQTQERSQRWLATKIGVSAQQVNQVIRGYRTLAAAEAYRAAVVLGEPVEALFLSTERDETSTDEEAAA